MVQVILKRKDNSKEVTFGTIAIDDITIGVTLELPWKNNEPLISCIPPGIYICKRMMSLKFGETFEICEVPNRSNIEFHCGNFLRDTHGCVLIGTTIAKSTTPIITNSVNAFNRFMLQMSGVNDFQFTILEPIKGPLQ